MLLLHTTNNRQITSNWQQKKTVSSTECCIILPQSCEPTLHAVLKMFTYIFLFWFCSAIWSDLCTRPLADPCFLKLTRAHALPEVVKIVNWRDPCFIQLKSPEQFEKKCCLSEGYELSVAIDKNVKNKSNWKWIQEVDADGVPFRHSVMSKVRWAEDCN